MWPAVTMLAQAAAAPFAPPLETPLLVVTERIEEGVTPLRFRLERRVRYSRDGAGFRAEVVVLRAAGEASAGAPGSLYEAGFAALIGMPITFRLDATGAVIAIESQAAAWDKLCAGVGDKASDERTRAIAAALRALPSPTQRALLGSLIASLAAEDAGEPLGSQPIRIPARSPLGGAEIALSGTRTIAPTPEGLIESISIATSDDANGGRAVEVRRQRQFDPATGLIAFARETTRTRINDVDAVRTTTLRVSRDGTAEAR